MEGIRTSIGVSRLSGVLLVAMCFTVLAIAPLQSAGNAEGPQRYALLVGISDYGPACGYGDLTYSHKDALDMYSLLVNQHGWDPSSIRLLLNESATEAGIMSGISWLKEVCSNPRSIGFFFFSGHGSFFCDRSAISDRDEPVDECIVPYDGDTRLTQHMIFDDTLKGQLDTFGPAKIVVMFDSCYSGGFMDEIESDGRLILTSCGEREMCWEGVETGKVQIENGLFAYCILEAFSGLGDLNGDGEVSVEEAGIYAIDRVQEFTPDVQPEMSDGVDGDTYI